jgi:CRP/FNR family cyclic AMP-dependent transcriptional regulator
MTKSQPDTGDHDTRAIFASSALFDMLDTSSLARLVKAARTVRLDRGQVYLRRGSRVEGVVIVARGYLRISLSNAEGKRHVVSHLGVGEIFDLLPVMDGGPAIHDAEAGLDTHLVVLPAATFLELQRKNPAVTAAALRLLNARARRLYDGLADAMLLTLSQRCARSLLDVVQAFGEPAGKDGAMSVRLSQSEFAEMLGNARPVVNSVLRKLQRDGVLELGYQRIVVLRPAALREAAGLPQGPR